VKSATKRTLRRTTRRTAKRIGAGGIALLILFLAVGAAAGFAVGFFLTRGDGITLADSATIYLTPGGTYRLSDLTTDARATFLGRDVSDRVTVTATMPLAEDGDTFVASPGEFSIVYRCDAFLLSPDGVTRVVRVVVPADPEVSHG